MSEHYHTSIENIIVTGVMALVFFNLWKIAAAKAVTSQSPGIQHAGKIMGSLITFGGA